MWHCRGNDWYSHFWRYCCILLQSFWAEKGDILTVLYRYRLFYTSMCFFGNSVWGGDFSHEFQLPFVSNFGSSFSVWGKGVLTFTSLHVQKGFSHAGGCITGPLWGSSGHFSDLCQITGVSSSLNFSVSTFAAKCFHISPLGLHRHKPHSHIPGLQYCTAAQLLDSWSQNYT